MDSTTQLVKDLLLICLHCIGCATCLALCVLPVVAVLGQSEQRLFHVVYALIAVFVVYCGGVSITAVVRTPWRRGLAAPLGAREQVLSRAAKMPVVARLGSVGDEEVGLDVDASCDYAYDICVVCLGPKLGEEDGGYRVLPCKHSFHTGCIDAWWLAVPHRDLTCPMCRYVVPK